MKTQISTEQATRIIAYVYSGGENNPEQAICLTDVEAAALRISDSEMERWQNAKSDDARKHQSPMPVKLQRTCRAMHQSARDWQWSKVTDCMLGAYALLGVVAEEIDHGYAFHRGEHPVQLAMSAS